MSSCSDAQMQVEKAPIASLLGSLVDRQASGGHKKGKRPPSSTFLSPANLQSPVSYP